VEFSAKAAANNMVIGFVIGLASEARAEAFKLRQAEIDIALSFDAEMLAVIAKAQGLQARNQSAKKLTEAVSVQKEIDSLFKQTGDLIEQAFSHNK
jgi:hypothetical protein